MKLNFNFKQLAIENFYDNHQEEVVLASESDEEPGFSSDPPIPEVRQPIPSTVRQPSPAMGAKALPIKTQSSSRLVVPEYTMKQILWGEYLVWWCRGKDHD